MKKLSTLILVLFALLAQPFTASAEDVVFDFTTDGLRGYMGTALNDAQSYVINETWTVDGVAMQVTSGAAPSRITNVSSGNRGNCLVMYMQYTTMTIKAPQGKLITKVVFEQAGSGNLGMSAANGQIDDHTWTGIASGVRFSVDATAYIAKATVTLAELSDMAELSYTECANIAAFNALEPGTYAKLTLKDAEVIGKSADGTTTVWVQDATGGCWIQYTSLNDKLNEKSKVSGTVYVVRRTASANPQMKESEDTPKSELTATAIADYTTVEGSIAEVNVAANLNKVVKITGATFVATSATAGTLQMGDDKIDVNNGTATANQQLHKIDATWMKDETRMENVTIVAILVAKSASANQLLPLSMEEVTAADATFDFQNNPENWPTSKALFDDDNGVVNTLTVNGVVMTSIQNNEWNANLLYENEDAATTVLRVAKENAFKLKAPEGKALVSVSVTMASGSFDFTASTGEIAENVWTGNASEVTFTTTANRSISKIDVMLADENAETVKPAIAIEVADIAAFNATEDGKMVKVTLTNARVNAVNGGSYYVEDATGATVVKGVQLTPGTVLNGYIIGTKSTDNNIDFMNDPALAVEYQLTATDASTFTATETTLEGTVMAMTEAAAQANYGRLITFENVTISGGGQNKTLTDADGHTFKARDYMGTLPTDYTWPVSASKITGVVIYYMTGWFLMPLSAEAIVATDAQGVRSVRSTDNDETVYNLNGVMQSRQTKGVNIVGGKKVFVK